MTTALSPPVRRRLPLCSHPPEPPRNRNRSGSRPFLVTGTALGLLTFHRHCFVIPAQAGIRARKSHLRFSIRHLRPSRRAPFRRRASHVSSMRLPRTPAPS